MSDDPQDAIAQAIRDAAQLILAGLCAIGEAIHESREEPEPEKIKPPVYTFVASKPISAYPHAFLCASVTCLEPPIAAQHIVYNATGNAWHLCDACHDAAFESGQLLSVVQRKGIPPKPDMTSLVRLKRL